jgi:hypothetical protein
MIYSNDLEFLRPNFELLKNPVKKSHGHENLKRMVKVLIKISRDDVNHKMLQAIIKKGPY